MLTHFSSFFSISIFFRAREGPDFSLIAQTDRFQPVRVPFEKGLAQKFVQPSGSGVKLSALDLSDLLEVKEEVYPLVLRAETSESSRTTRNENSIIIDTKGVGAPLPKHVGAQTTNCILEEKSIGILYDDCVLIAFIEYFLFPPQYSTLCSSFLCGVSSSCNN